MQSYKGLTRLFASDFAEQPDSPDVERNLRTAVRNLCKEMPLIMFDKVGYDRTDDGIYTLTHDGYEFISIIHFLIGIGEGDNECLYNAAGADLIRTIQEGDNDTTLVYLRDTRSLPKQTRVRLYFSFKCAPKGDSTEFPAEIRVKHWELIRYGLLAEMGRFAWMPKGAPTDYWRMKFEQTLMRERAQKGGAIASGGVARPWIGGRGDRFDDIADENYGGDFGDY